MQIGSGFCLGDKTKPESLIQTPSKLQNNRLKQKKKTRLLLNSLMAEIWIWILNLGSCSNMNHSSFRGHNTKLLLSLLKIGSLIILKLLIYVCHITWKICSLYRHNTQNYQQGSQYI